MLKMAREIAPKMLQNYKEQKHIKQQKHIEMLQKKKDEATKKKWDHKNKTRYWGQWLLKFSTEGNKLTLNQLLSNFRILANISISGIAVSDENALENSACSTEAKKPSLTIKNCRGKTIFHDATNTLKNKRT